jgi:membrane protein implicated in regulation of membrane protease activity|nr:NfeD family protein [uncultured Caldimonas sp.]
MELTASTLWWVLAGIAVVAELTTGTFYLLMIALGLVGGALAAHAGLGFAMQLVAAAAIGGGGVAAWRVRRKQSPPALPPSTNRDVNLDIGGRVTVVQWNSDRTARVPYRGATWSVRYAGTDDPQPGEHVIRAVEGTVLIIERQH